MADVMTDATTTQNIRIVLVRTSHAGNIGAAARAMKNMCLSRLVLVQPHAFPDAEASARASGAEDVLAAARVVPDLDAALQGCALVFGASARPRAIAWPTVDARRCAAEIAATVNDAEVALVFGRENSGLTNTELERCNYLVHIPANPGYSSLNLGAAVQLLAYEIYMALGAPGQVAASAQDYPLATADEIQGLFQHLERALSEIGFLDPRNPKQLMRRLRRLFNRCRLDKMELNILRGILSAAQGAARADATSDLQSNS
jgi:tRNA (cytidine32/uridine32-2'-O)-methyltransferase